jgi:hypothetical protein
MKDWNCPKTLKTFHGFLGLIVYYCNFVFNYGKIGSLLTNLLKRNDSSWTPITDQSLQALKDAMCTTPILTLSNFTKTFVLECDVLGKGIGAVLMQHGQSLAFTTK